MNFLRRLFRFFVAGKAPALTGRNSGSPSPVSGAATAPDPEAGARWQPALDTDAGFFAWLVDNGALGLDAASEKTILAALARLCQSELAGSNLVPRVPSVLPQLLKSLREENVSGTELARHIAKDVVLVAELIGEVNSAYYNPPGKIGSLDSAIRLLGLNGLRMLVARVAFRPLIQRQSGRMTKLVAPRLWEQTEKCALACRLLAQQRQLDPFHGFLAGLLQNVGLIVAFRVADQVGDVASLCGSDAFRQAFALSARTLSQRIAVHWGFPPAVVQALADQVQPGHDLRGLSLVLRQADQLSKLRLLVDQQQLQEQDERLQLEQAPQLQACFLALGQAAG